MIYVAIHLAGERTCHVTGTRRIGRRFNGLGRSSRPIKEANCFTFSGGPRDRGRWKTLTDQARVSWARHAQNHVFQSLQNGLRAPTLRRSISKSEF